jgi:DNA-directed RNA polymerase subunit RPC12/RpoP
VKFHLAKRWLFVENLQIMIWSTPLLNIGKPRVLRYAKTLYKSTPPKEVEKRIREATQGKLPYFFKFVKDKNNSQVESLDVSGKRTVGRLMSVIPNYRFDFKIEKTGKFDYRMLMNNPNLIHTTDVQHIIDEYNRLVREIRRLNSHDIEEGIDRHSYQFKLLREKIFALNSNHKYLVDAIIYGIFKLHKTAYKTLFWGAFGDIVLENLSNNLSKQENVMLCPKCYSRFAIEDDRMICPHCNARVSALITRRCIDCGEDFITDARNNNHAIRCPSCYREYRRDYIANFMKAQRKC